MGSRTILDAFILQKSRVNGVPKHLGCFYFAQVTSERGLEGTHLRKLTFPAFLSQPIRNPSEIRKLSKYQFERRLSHIQSRRAFILGKTGPMEAPRWSPRVLHESLVKGVSKHLGCFHFAQVTSEWGLEAIRDVSICSSHE